MIDIASADPGLLFMKVGLHAGESFEEILERKKREYETTGMTFWGYGGGTCHPTRYVQPFARLKIEQREKIYIVMQQIDSRHAPETVMAEQYSEDGINWENIPEGIEVRSSRYAVVLGEIRQEEIEVDLADYKVGVGPSTGKSAPSYIKGRVDKACLTKKAHIGGPPEIHKISHVAEIIDPYAVFIK